MLQIPDGYFQHIGLYEFCAFLETAINIISGQWVLLVLKAGYLTNTTYGYIKWTQYIKSHQKQPDELPVTEQA